MLITSTLQTQVPEIDFHELSQHLNDKSTIKDLRRIGLVVVRDVIADADAQAAGEELRAYTQARAGHGEYLLYLGPSLSGHFPSLQSR